MSDHEDHRDALQGTRLDWGLVRHIRKDLFSFPKPNAIRTMFSFELAISLFSKNTYGIGTFSSNKSCVTEIITC
jgi:hypothetical protein